MLITCILHVYCMHIAYGCPACTRIHSTLCHRWPILCNVPPLLYGDDLRLPKLHLIMVGSARQLLSMMACFAQRSSRF